MSSEQPAKRVLVDFDGVLHSYVQGWTGPEPTDPPSPGALEFVRELVDAGLDVIVFTTRAATPQGMDATVRWLAEHGFPELNVTYQKLPAVCTVDDRAVRYERAIGFDAALEEVMEFVEGLRP